MRISRRSLVASTIASAGLVTAAHLNNAPAEPQSSHHAHNVEIVTSTASAKLVTLNQWDVVTKTVTVVGSTVTVYLKEKGKAHKNQDEDECEKKKDSSTCKRSSKSLAQVFTSPSSPESTSASAPVNGTIVSIMSIPHPTPDSISDSIQSISSSENAEPASTASNDAEPTLASLLTYSEPHDSDHPITGSSSSESRTSIVVTVPKPSSLSQETPIGQFTVTTAYPSSETVPPVDTTTERPTTTESDDDTSPTTAVPIEPSSPAPEQSQKPNPKEAPESSDSQTRPKPLTVTTNPNAVSKIPLDGMVFSPFKDDRSCKSQEEMRKDLKTLRSRAISSLRIYATECNTLDYMVQETQAAGIKIDQGFWISQEGVDSIDQQVEAVMKYGQKYGWDMFSMMLVGNEAILSKYCSPNELIQKLQSVKSKLRQAGYQGPVGTAEPPVIYNTYPELCQNEAIELVGINSHPYFDANQNANTAGQFVASEIEMIERLCPNKNVYVTETGYPSAGSVNGGNVPSKQNQATAIAGILEATKGTATILTMYDDYWKDPGPYGIEQHFGIIDLV